MRPLTENGEWRAKQKKRNCQKCMPSLRRSKPSIRRASRLKGLQKCDTIRSIRTAYRSTSN
ncbi:MAG: hypothetical protein ACXAHE_07835 [Roseburia sp. 1XD42-69]